MKLHRRYPPDDPREWLNRARSNLSKAANSAPGVYLEDLCFDAQQAAEKAVKALLLARGVDFPYVHDLGLLLTLLEDAGQDVPEAIRQAEKLNPFATATRYPSIAQPVSEQEYEESLGIAEAVVQWAEASL
ncbi:MAG: HEPN domain-containing protein [Chloroflexi bacterium]|nr:HEPN domain-containing protein [Chloroflexota bacterium]